MNKVIANLKTLSIDMIHEAQSGHPGIALSAAPIMYTVYANHMHINPKDPNWINRDRFVLSAGHGSALLYACLYMVGYITLKDLKQFRRLGSITPGHPEYNVTPGVEVSTGPLGQGFASAVGMAIGEKRLREKFKDSNLIDNYIYVLCSDGDLMEGLSYEAASLAGTLKLDNLIVLYDSNNISLDGNINQTFTEDVRERFDSMGWYTTLVRDGNKENEIDKAINRAKRSGLPSLIEVKTVLGAGSIFEGTNIVHGKPLSEDDICQLHNKLNIPNEKFYVDEEAVKFFREKIMKRSSEKYINWRDDYNYYVRTRYSGNENELLKFYNKIVEINSSSQKFVIEDTEATRDSNSKMLNYLASQTDLLFGGSADLFGSNKTYINNGGNFTKDNYLGRNIFFGVREHAMGAILNGIALSGYLPYGSTFLAFADYLKPAIRMGALMNLPVTYIFTHDSINVGCDGPTHQPIEQLSSLRSIPNFTVYRPADFKEVAGVWNAIITLKVPSAIVLSKCKTENLDSSDAKEVLHGGYIIRKEKKDLDAILIATGSEVSTCVKIAEELAENYDIRVVSMPSVELFLKMPKKYQNKVLPIGIKTFFVEASSSYGLRRFVTNDKYLVTLGDFGKSGPVEEVLDAMDFSYEKIKTKILDLL